MAQGPRTKSARLPPRTAEIFTVLRLLAGADDRLAFTMSEIASICGVSRRTLYTHIVRLRAAGALIDGAATLEKCGRWRRERRILDATTSSIHRVGLINPANLANSPPNPKDIREENKTKGLDPIQLENPLPRAFRALCPALRAGLSEIEGGMTATPTPEHEEIAAGTDDLLRRVLTQQTVTRGELRHDDLPPYPGAPHCPPVYLPPMPRLQQDLHAAAKQMMIAYKGLSAKIYGSRPRCDNKTTFRMKVAAQSLHKHSIDSAHAWAAFRFAAWSMSEQSTRAPGIDFVYAASVIEKSAAHFHTVRESYDVRRMSAITPAHAHLLRLWERAATYARVAKPGAAGVELSPRARAESILSPSMYAELVARAGVERETAAVEYRRRLADGEWIW